VSLIKTDYEHIAICDSVPIIAGTTIKVVELVTERIAYGWSPEELHFQHPYLTLGQIYSALAYYYDHVEKLNQDIERRLEHVRKLSSSLRKPLEHIRQTIKPPPLISQLKSKGLL
jgi:uncharacterized protein (DUF433 family)